jgi:hypothetical protein
VEEQTDVIVRFNGTYLPATTKKRTPKEVYFHFDSWRTNPIPDVWIPSLIYVEDQTEGAQLTARFKAQTRFWDFAAHPSSKLDEYTQILVEQESGIKDRTQRHSLSPFESQRAWEHQAEENVLSRLEKGGLLAPPGPVDEVLDGVVQNLTVSANLNLEVHCRVLLTTPFETFSIGHTIVISRGLIDVLPDETSLALALAEELGHISLGHPTPTRFAFSYQTMLTDAELLRQFRLERAPAEMEAAETKTLDIMEQSAYKRSPTAGLFLKALASRRSALPNLLTANLGNQFASPGALERFASFMDAAPPLDQNKLDQIAALPLGSRIQVDPWTDKITMVPTKPISLLSPREKMPFEVTPFFDHLTLAATH